MIFSRILSLKNMFYSKTCETQMANLLDKTFTVPQTYRASVVKVTRGFVARPDLLSKQLYGNEMYSDILMKANGISNPYELNEGMYIVAPSASYLEKFVHAPATVWNESKYDSTVMVSTPKQKSKNEKRKPNESVLGDTRYNIDRTSRIVIY